MSDVCWRDCIDVIGAKPFGDNQESRIANASSITGVSQRKLRALYYGETDEPKFTAGVKIRTAALKQADRFDAIAASLEATDEAFHRESIDRYRALARRIRRTDD